MSKKNFEGIGNRDDHLIEELSELATACNEAIKAIVKIKRFGPNNYHPDDVDKKSNAALFADAMEAIDSEYNDVHDRFHEYVKSLRKETPHDSA